MQVVTVVEQRSGATAKLDRDVYDVKNNPATSNASAADVLNNVPAVSVDGDGKVTLRGSQNVKIMVDGKPAAQFQGEGGGAALNSLPAAALESVEVISTPGAEFGTEGGGGPILNLIMKRVQPPGMRGTISANAGVGKRYNANAFGTYSDGRISADGSFSVRRDKSEYTSEGTRRQSLSSGTIESRQSASGASPNDSVRLSTTLNYNLRTKERLMATLTLSRNESSSERNDHTRSFRNGADTPYEDYLRLGENSRKSNSRMFGAAYERKFDRPGEELRVDLRYSDDEWKTRSRYDYNYLIKPPSRINAGNSNNYASPTRILDLTADYTLRLTRQSMMKSGLKVAQHRGERDQDYFAFDPVTGEEVLSTDRSTAFASNTMTYALYGTYDYHFTDDLRAGAGVRAEYTDQELRYREQNRTVNTSHLNFMPNLMLGYDYSKNSKFKLLYSQRVERPRTEDLNPFLQYRDEYNSSLGDPRLPPQKTRNFELGWDLTMSKARSSLRLTRASNKPLMAFNLVPVADSTAVISQRISYGYTTNDTLSLNLSYNVSTAWMLSTTATIGYDERDYLRNERDAAGVLRSVGAIQRAKRNQLQVMTNYRFTPETSASLMAMWRDRMITAFGTTDPWGTSNLTINHRLSNRLSLRMNVNDIFEWSKFGRVYETGVLSDRNLTQNKGRIFYLGFTYSMGGVTGMGSARPAHPGMPTSGAPMMRMETR